MKKISLILAATIVSLALFSFLKLDKPANNYYRIISEVTNDTFPDETTIITGKVISRNAKNPIHAIAFQKEGEKGKDYKVVYTDEDGSFRMIMPPMRGVLYATTILSNEIVIPMREYKNRTSLEVNFYSDDSLKNKEIPHNNHIVEPQPSFKPVIYLYNQEKIDVSLKLNYKGDLTFTYPTYKNGWDVTVKDNKISVDGKEYPYLFWEGEMTGLEFKRDIRNQIPCRIANQDNLIKSLEQELTGMGLNDTERTDFITFWAPRMLKHKKVAFQFLRNTEYTNEVAALKVTPKPDISNRIYLLYTEVTPKNKEQFVEIRTQYEPFVRTGFTLIEWGGTELEKINIEKIDHKVQVSGTFRNATMNLDIKRGNIDSTNTNNK